MLQINGSNSNVSSEAQSLPSLLVLKLYDREINIVAYKNEKKLFSILYFFPDRKKNI